jgi:uncharacterized protein
MEFDLWVYLLLFCTGLAAGLVDAVAGGGGVLTVPVLLSIGLPVQVALGTNKLQASFGSATATIHYIKGGLVDLRECRLGIAATAVGAALGAYVVRRIQSELLENLVPWLLAGIVIYTIVRPKAGSADHPPRLPHWMFFALFGVALGFYDGFFGPGTGSFWTIALVGVMGFNFAKATGYTKVMNFTSNVTSLAVFAWAGSIHLWAGLVMAAGQVAGSRVGAGLVMKRGARFVRPLFLCMVVATVGRLLYVQFWPR